MLRGETEVERQRARAGGAADLGDGMTVAVDRADDVPAAMEIEDRALAIRVRGGGPGGHAPSDGGLDRDVRRNRIARPRLSLSTRICAISVARGFAAEPARTRAISDGFIGGSAISRR